MLKIDRFLKNNLIMFVSGSIVNLFNLLYHLLLVRNVSTKVYGELNSLLSLLVIIAIPCSSFSTMVVKFTSKFHAQQLYINLKALLNSLFYHTLILSISAFLLISLLSPMLASFLQLDSIMPVFFLAVIVFLSTIMPTIAGGLQGLEKFGWLASASVVSGFFKILLAFIFVVLLGRQLYGALGAFIISSLLVLLITLWPLKEFFFRVEKNPCLNLKEVYSYFLPSFVVFLCFSLLTNIDIVLVKHFFSPTLAGTYSVAQIIGKIIFFLPGTISVVMFPRLSFLHTQNKDTLHTLKRSLKYSAILCILGLIIYNLFPHYTLQILTKKTGSEYIALGRLFSISMAFFSLSGILLLYQLSINNFKFIKFLIPLTIIQILAISVFSTFYKSLYIILIILCINSFILFLSNFKLTFEK